MTRLRVLAMARRNYVSVAHAEFTEGPMPVRKAREVTIMTKDRDRASQQKEGRTGHESLAGHLDAPLMDFNLLNEIAQLHQEEAWLEQAITRRLW